MDSDIKENYQKKLLTKENFIIKLTEKDAMDIGKLIKKSIREQHEVYTDTEFIAPI